VGHHLVDLGRIDTADIVGFEDGRVDFGHGVYTWL
jgi:hypothetical protein